MDQGILSVEVRRRPAVNISSAPASRRALPGNAASVRISTLNLWLLECGLAASLLYAAMNVVVPMFDVNYSCVTQTVSELSAIDAPTRPLWAALASIYTLFFVLFGWGVWRSASGNRALRVVASLFIFCGLFGIFWPPMHLRGETTTLTDTLHIAWTAAWGLLTMLAMGFSAFAFGKNFRWFSLVSIVLLLGFGAMTSLEAPNITKNLPTPTIGVWERLNIGVFLVWLAVLAIVLLRRQGALPKGSKRK